MRERLTPCWKPCQRPLAPKVFEISFRGNDGHDLRSLDDDLARFLAAQTVGDGFQRHLLKFLRVDVGRNFKLGTNLALDLHDRGDGVLSDIAIVGLRPFGVRQRLAVSELVP